VHPAFPAPSEFQMRFMALNSRGVRGEIAEVWVFSPRPACGERSKPQASGEGDYRRLRMRGDSPSPPTLSPQAGRGRSRARRDRRGVCDYPRRHCWERTRRSNTLAVAAHGLLRSARNDVIKNGRLVDQNRCEQCSARSPDERSDIRGVCSRSFPHIGLLMRATRGSRAGPPSYSFSRLRSSRPHKSGEGEVNAPRDRPGML
jgi:hypothetical protein